MPATVIAATATLKVILRGHGEETRDWIGVTGQASGARACVLRENFRALRMIRC